MLYSWPATSCASARTYTSLWTTDKEASHCKLAQLQDCLDTSRNLLQLTGQVVGAKDRLVEFVAVYVRQWELKGHKPCPQRIERV